MLAYFPQPYPDELLYSLLARYHRHMCSVSPKQTFQELFGDRSVRVVVDLQPHLGALSAHLPAGEHFSPSRLAQDFTLFPYYTAFQPEPVVVEVLKALIDGQYEAAHFRLGMAPSTVRTPPVLRFCPDCHTMANVRWGEWYWRRAHQLPGVLVCPEHGGPLRETRIPFHSAGHRGLIAAGDTNCPPTALIPAWVASPVAMRMLGRIARDSAALLEPSAARSTLAGIEARVRGRAIAVGIASESGRVDQRRLEDLRRLVLSPITKVLPAANGSWLSAILRKHRHAFHPLHHILLDLLLEAAAELPVPNPRHVPTRRRFLAADPTFEHRLKAVVAEGNGLRSTARALGVDTNTVRFHAHRLGLTVPWKDPPERKTQDKGDELRQCQRARWIALRKQEPNLGRKALRMRLPAEFIWLYRSDREWLEAHSPVAQRKRPTSSRRDWKAADRKLVTELRTAAKRLVSVQPPVRITMAALERQVGRPGWIGPRRKKLPESTAMLTQIAETVDEFRIRRIVWARDQLQAAGDLPPIWKIRRMAGLPTRVSSIVERALHLEPRDLDYAKITDY